MNSGVAIKKLYEVTDFELIPIKEYQDKYYFLKKIKGIFPEVPDKKIAGAIEFANNEAKFPGIKKKFINALSFKMFHS
jgi:hypothetical protein